MLKTKNLEYLNFIKYPDIHIQKGKMVFIQGESGAGKSSLIRLFNNTMNASNGSIYFKNRNILDYDPIELRRDVLLVPQSVYLFDESIEENFNRFYKYREEKVISKEQMKKMLSVTSANFDLSTNCSTLSGGEKQRVFIAIFLSFDFEVLLLDEPTSALDEKTARILMSNLKDYKERTNSTIIIVSHDPMLAKEYGDEVIYLERGEYESNN